VSENIFAQKFRAYFDLTKFRLSSTVVFSSAIGFTLASDKIVWSKLLLFSIAAFATTVAANIINQIIERNLDKTFENCKTIIISEKYNGTEVSISLKRKENITSWKKGAWVDDNGISYKNPNDCWKKLIANHFGEIGLKKFNGQNVWGKNGRLITITNRGNIFDINQNPMRVIMDLEKCKGLYLGREFFSYKEEDFIQMV
jgi:hypothetical protein